MRYLQCGKVRKMSSDLKKRTSKAITIKLLTEQDDARPVWITGSFNNWELKDPAFLMTRIAKGVYVFQLPSTYVFNSDDEFKFTKGTWDSVELNAKGFPTPNRKLKRRGVNFCKVEHWAREKHNYTFSPEIRIISETFEIPQLGKKRRIAAILPYDYAYSNKRYPVLYLQDGQNLYNDFAPFGTWAVDKSMTKLAEAGKGDVIIVAIDHGGSDRISEFLPYATGKFTSSHGKEYVLFLNDTLKPYIDSNFRTLPEREHTAMGGSSMGGLISIYCGLRYPQTFGKLMIFSPSLWINPSLHFEAMFFRKLYKTKIYLYAGEREGASMVPLVKDFMNKLTNKGLDKSLITFKLAIDPHGHHNEARWGREFPIAMRWLFRKE